MSKLGRGTLFAMGLRANLLQAAWNFERQQGLGWAHALLNRPWRWLPSGSTGCCRMLSPNVTMS